jgi:hypothetical protein
MAASLLERAAFLAPVLVVLAGATAFLFVLWGKVVRESLRQSRHPALIVAGVVAVIGLLTALSFRA